LPVSAIAPSARLSPQPYNGARWKAPREQACGPASASRLLEVPVGGQNVSHITVERDDAVAILTFNRPEVLNAFNNALMHESLEAMAALNRDEGVRAIVVRGAGRAFSAGFDLKASAERRMDDVSDWERQMKLQFDFIMQFWDSPKPTIACVHGFCLAGAFEAMLACDVTVAAEGTRFGEPEVRFGTGIVAMLLPWITGPKQAKELLLTGDDRIDATDAHRLGIVNHVVPAGEEFTRSMALARTMARAAERSVRLTKRAINQTYETMGLRAALQASLDIDVLLNAGDSPEKAEFARIRSEQGVKAAIAWRDARFK
jgi:enoyl-CoA hydratase